MDFKNILIIGGKGRMGAQFSTNFKSLQLSVALSDIDTPFDETIRLIQKADLIMVSVPMQKTLEILEKIDPYLESHQIITELSSVKTHTESFIPKKATFIPVHPLFGPMLKSIQGYNLIMISKPNTNASRLKELFQSMGLNVVILESAQKHDHYMSLIQGLTHFVHILFAKTLQTQDAQLKELLEICSPIYKAYFSFSCRIISQNPDLYNHILVDNPHNVLAIEDLVQNSQNILDLIKNGDIPKLDTLFQDLKFFLGDLADDLAKQSELLVEQMQNKA